MALSSPCRIVIRLLTDDIDGVPQSRHTTVAEELLKRHYTRAFDPNHDYIHCPPQIDSPNTKCFVFVDLDASSHRDLTPGQVPLCCFRAEKGEDSSL